MCADTFLSIVVSLPISYVTYPVLPDQTTEWLLSAHVGTTTVVSLFAARLRFGWTFVSTRLRNRVNYFEDQQAGGPTQVRPDTAGGREQY